MKKFKNLKLIAFNLCTFIFFISVIEILFGQWRKNFISQRNYFQIPYLIKDVHLKYDARRIYNTKNPILINYHRDKDGYRSRDKESKKLIILTIGGSTTDQRFVNDGETWQDILDRKIPKFDFINGGVDGQSSYGYKRAINFWHAKYLDPKKTNSIIFYTGVNDVRLISRDFINYDFAQTKIRYFQNLLKDNSFFFNKFVELKNIITFRLDTQKINSHNAHYGRTVEFKGKGTLYEINKEIKLSEYPKYSEIYLSLLESTKNKFPNSNLYVVQQQIPGCNFINKKKVMDRHPDDFEYQFCLDLMKVYLIQEKIIYQFFNDNNIKIAPMYLRPYLQDDDVYDYIHTNSKGSLKIAEYIDSFIRLNIK
tara:strand:+ start:2828 stop:3925 length:1098 start_codon:yes stop_codon:yes gene_type:complete